MYGSCAEGLLDSLLEVNVPGGTYRLRFKVLTSLSAI